jgi:arylformamidase
LKQEETEGKTRIQEYKEIIDLSVPMTSMDTPVYPGYPQPLRSTFTTIRDNGYASFVWIFAEHSSTHVDSPGHFSQGSPMINEVPIKKYVGRGVVLDFSNREPRYAISRKNISSQLEKAGHKVGPGWMLLFYTGYTEKSRTKDWLEHPELSEDACNYIVKLGVNAVGFDAPGPDHQPFPAHKILLPKLIGIYENLANLDKVLGKDFLFVGAPLALTGGSASPCRALALVF